MKENLKENLKEADILIGESSGISKDIAWLFDHRFEPIMFVDERNEILNTQLNYGYDIASLYGFSKAFKAFKTEFRVVAMSRYWQEDNGKKKWFALLPLDWEFGNMFDIVLMKEDGIDMTDDYDMDGIASVFKTAFKKYGGKRVEFGESSLVQFGKGTAEASVRHAVACATEIASQLSAMNLRPLTDREKYEYSRSFRSFR